jgi:translocation and assembly module TamB
VKRKRFAWKLAAVCAALAVIAAISVFAVLKSAWFHERLRTAIVSAIEKATGGRAEIGAFRFDVNHLRAEVKEFTLHGTEGADKPPLVHAASVAIGLKIVSLIDRNINVRSLDVTSPRIYLVIYPDGRTNIPQPRVKSKSTLTTAETIVKLAIGQFSARNGVFEIEARSSTPFDLRGQDFNASLTYDATGPRYRGNISVQPVDARFGSFAPVPVGVVASFALENNRIAVDSAHLTTGESSADVSGALENLVSPYAKFRYDARAAIADVARIFSIPPLKRGTAQVGGNATWVPASGDYSLTGNLHAYGVEYRDSSVRMQNFRADGAVSASPKGVDATGVRYSGESAFADKRLPVSGHVALLTVRGSDLTLRGTTLEALDGTFNGDVTLQALDRLHVAGKFAGLGARRAIAMYSGEPLPWDGMISGNVELDGSLKRNDDLAVKMEASISPAAQGPPVHGELAASYDARSGILDLGRSTVTLPSSVADVSGAIGHSLRVHLETRDLNDFLPVLGESAASVPLKFQNGGAVFDGTVTGKLDNPQISGHLNVTNFSYSGEAFNLLAADVTASSESIRLQNAAAARGSLRAQFQGTAAIKQWKADDNTVIAGSGSLRNASVAELAGIAHAEGLQASGTLTANGQVSGTIGRPAVTGDVAITKGVIRSEPFDRFIAQVNYTGNTLAIASGELDSGASQMKLSASFDHKENHLDAGRLRFQVASNAMALERIRNLQDMRPGIKGTLQLAANGSLDLAPSNNEKDGETLRIADLQVTAAALGLQMTGQALGDAHLTATSQNGILRAHLDSDFADSVIRGDGEWRLEGDYPGAATVNFSKLDFAQLREWISPAAPGATNQIEGSAEGELHVNGSVLKPEAVTAELRIPKLELAPAPNAGGPAATFKLTNSGPIVASMANSVITVESAHLVGLSTDLSVTGKVQWRQKNPLDLHVAGRVDLAVVHEFNHDFAASGALMTDASVRGAFDAPQINGRVQFQDASFNVVDFSNGLSNASGIILFSGDRATIQSLTGESGGGKVECTGFTSFTGGQAVFRLHLRADSVRVRLGGVSTVADASLNLTGASDRSMLAGTITILRTSFNPQSDFSSLIAKSAEPVRTPSARTGLLGGLNFDVQIATSPDIQVQTSLTQDVKVDANLRLRGTASNPAVLGRVNITQGLVVFFGTKFNINNGTISFYNPVKVEPVLDIDLETKARGIEVTLTVSGPLNKLTLTPRSDPPLQFSEIVGLLATGRAPTSDPALLAEQSTAPQSWQQMGASALLGQAIASPVAGRLQRFFGVSRLRIDPTLPGIETNPQARLTLEQQVTPDITFTYITNVTTTNPQIVQVEWAFSKQWSVVALREENGMFGLDFFFKKRF